MPDIPSLIMQENSQPGYISLKEGAKYSGCYSPGYLSLRARQGKLKAVKIASNWVTTKEWLDEYLIKVENYKKQTADGNKEKKTCLGTCNSYFSSYRI